VPILKGNLHAHTTFSDGRRPVAEVVEWYREQGYDFLAITDHDDRVDEDEYWFRIPSSDDRMIVFPGIELNYRPLWQHVGKVVGDRETLYVLNHPARYDLSVGEVRRRIRLIGAAGWPIEAVETTETGTYYPEYDVADIGVPRIATDDSHRDDDFGRAWIEVDAQRAPDAILRAVKAGDFKIAFKG